MIDFDLIELSKDTVDTIRIIVLILLIYAVLGVARMRWNMNDLSYQHTLRLLQIELVKLQKSIIKHDEKILIILKDAMQAVKMAQLNVLLSI